MRPPVLQPRCKANQSYRKKRLSLHLFRRFPTGGSANRRAPERTRHVGGDEKAYRKESSANSPAWRARKFDSRRDVGLNPQPIDLRLLGY